ncbi:Arylsulfatase A [Paracoccus halophilus]|uniref:Arylsulfatase A n=1 Tax=Paracoccus halophilus TaxID=376733 RepID=A0A099EY12_9RHOB|nr:sulfatase-like hydrolase/transferase [Paracoccus halophilus]KGJ03079.1 phosphonate monoester hydrolase [Paracoccus halophilus]SFA53139.1 Arylsulfatase A [Paracoccus halophilus]
MTHGRSSNILFIMCDQLRHDYLGCYGHPALKTPHIDSLAERGMRFDRAYVQSPVCGPSRMSTYTGRYPRSHGTTWNSFPLRVGEMGMGDHLRPLGVRTALCGKTHMVADRKGMERLGIAPSSPEGRLMAECGFELWDRLDGLHQRASGKQPTHYQARMQARGYRTDNPWEDYANAPLGDHGEALSPWHLSQAHRPARAAERDTETAYSTDRAIEFMEDAGDRPWCLHLSYIKPHWPYVAPAPYHRMYGARDVIPVVRSDMELRDPHPILREFHRNRVSQVFSRPEVRDRVIPVYMGLIKQIDDNIGRLLDYLRKSGQAQRTMIVFTSDHGDYLGDHWLGEKDMFHDCAVRVPLIVMDPSPAADATRGTVSDALVECIDLLPTFIEYYGGTVPTQIIEGKSLIGLLHRSRAKLREVAISEYDYSVRKARVGLEMPVADCRMQMVFDGRFKLVNVVGFRPMLFDLAEDPDELRDLGADPACREVIVRLTRALLDWALRHHCRVTVSDADLQDAIGGEARAGIYLGCWDQGDIDQIIRSGDSGY